MKGKYKCIFNEGWDCPIQTPEVPVEVCKLCLQARGMYSRVIRRVERAEVKELAVGKEGAREVLSRADSLFIEGKISLDEYMRRRRELTGALEGTPAKSKWETGTRKPLALEGKM